MKSCERASELTSISYDRKLSPGEFIGLWIHRALCGPCRIYRRQMLTLRKRAAELGDAAAPDTSFDDQAKARIRERLRAAKSDD